MTNNEQRVLDQLYSLIKEQAEATGSAIQDITVQFVGYIKLGLTVSEVETILRSLKDRGVIFLTEGTGIESKYNITSFGIRKVSGIDGEIDTEVDDTVKVNTKPKMITVSGDFLDLRKLVHFLQGKRFNEYGCIDNLDVEIENLYLGIYFSDYSYGWRSSGYKGEYYQELCLNYSSDLDEIYSLIREKAKQRVEY